jgi:membrane associated rhomboid family serine protease
MLKSLPPLTRSILLALAISTFAYLFLRDTWVALLALHGPAVTQHFEIWRLLTYPFVASLYSALGAGLITWFFGSELEQIIHTQKLSMMLAASILVGGVIFILIDPSGFLYGPAMIGVFLFTGFAYMWPERQLSVMGLFWVKAWVIALAYLVIMLIPSAGTRLDLRASAIFAPLFAAVSSLVMFHLMFKQHSLTPKFAEKIIPNKRPVEEANDPKSIERRIDQILDKIASKGMNSLTQEEKDFLLVNSKR